METKVITLCGKKFAVRDDGTIFNTCGEELELDTDKDGSLMCQGIRAHRLVAVAFLRT